MDERVNSNPSDSPKDEARRHGDPGDAAGLGPFGVLVYVPAAAAQADQVGEQEQQAQAQTDGTDARQQYQRLGGVGRGGRRVTVTPEHFV